MLQFSILNHQYGFFTVNSYVYERASADPLSLECKDRGFLPSFDVFPYFS